MADKATKPVREVNKNRFVQMFKNGLDPEEQDSIIEHFARIEDKIIKYIGEKDFIPRYKNAIIEFGEWYLGEFSRDEFEDFVVDDYHLRMPLILMIYFDIADDDIWTKQHAQWNRYIKMFQYGYKNNIETLIAQLAYVDTYFGMRASGDDDESDEFFDANIDALVIFYKWFNANYDNEKVDDAITDCWYGEYPSFYILCEDYMDGYDEDDLTDEQIEDMLSQIEVDYKGLTYSQRKNIDILCDYMFGFDVNKTIIICPLGSEPMEPMYIPAEVNKNNPETKRDLQYIQRAIKGYIATLMINGGLFVFAHNRGETKLVFNGFYMAEKEIYCVEPENLEGAVEFVTDEKVELVYEAADLMFAN